MTGWMYWLGFAAVCVVALYGIPWLIDRCEARAEETDRRTWRAMGGGRW